MEVDIFDLVSPPHDNRGLRSGDMVRAKLTSQVQEKWFTQQSLTRMLVLTSQGAPLESDTFLQNSRQLKALANPQNITTAQDGVRIHWPS